MELWTNARLTHQHLVFLKDGYISSKKHLRQGANGKHLLDVNKMIYVYK